MEGEGGGGGGASPAPRLYETLTGNHPIKQAWCRIKSTNIYQQTHGTQGPRDSRFRIIFLSSLSLRLLSCRLILGDGGGVGALELISLGSSEVTMTESTHSPGEVGPGSGLLASSDDEES